MSLRETYHNKWVRMGFWSVLYVLWVIWLGNYWWLFGLAVIFDHHITHKVKWMFWKKEYKEGEKRNVWLDWLDAIIFAVIVVTFINIFFFQAFKIPSSARWLSAPRFRRLRFRFLSRTTSYSGRSHIRLSSRMTTAV